MLYDMLQGHISSMDLIALALALVDTLRSTLRHIGLVMVEDYRPGPADIVRSHSAIAPVLVDLQPLEVCYLAWPTLIEMP